MLIEALRETNFLSVKDIIGNRVYAFLIKSYGNRKYPMLDIPYTDYVFGVAEILKVIGADPTVISAATIYPLPSVTGRTLEELTGGFGEKLLDKEILGLVEEIQYLSKFEWNILSTHNEQEESIEIVRKMFLLTLHEFQTQIQIQELPKDNRFQDNGKQKENVIRLLLAATTDIRALIIKLAEHLQLMRLLNTLPQLRKEALREEATFHAQINLSVYAPLANRLGIWRLKCEIEDSSFQFLQPHEFKDIADQLQKDDRQKLIKEITHTIRKRLKLSIKNLEVYSREKYIYRIYQKMKTNNLSLHEINDILGVRIIVDTQFDCYETQRILHEFWPPRTEFYNGEPGRDWIENPKPNKYQSLHTTIAFMDKIVEVQIRTTDMHKVAEWGPAAHWRYKECEIHGLDKKPMIIKSKDQILSEHLAKLRTLLVNTEGSINLIQKGLLRDQIFVITPKGDVINLPEGATPLDFAYRIHTDFGDTFRGAKVDGCLVDSDYKLQNGQIVKVITSSVHTKPSTGPNPKWFCQDEKSGSYYIAVRTSLAKRKIRSWFRAN